MTRAMILSTIKNMDSLLKAADRKEDSNNKLIRYLVYKKVDLCSPVVKMAGSGEDSKKKLLSFLVDVAAFGGDDMKQLCRFLAEMASFSEDYGSLVGIKDSREEKRYSILVGMADFWKGKLGTVNEEISMNSLLIAMADLDQDNKEKLYTLLIGVVDYNKEELYRSVFWKGDLSENEEKLKLYVFLDGIMDSCKIQMGKQVDSLKGNNPTTAKEKSLYSLLSDFCQDHKEKVYRSLIGKGDFENEKKIKLYSLVDRMTDFCASKKENLYNLLARVEDPWKYYNKTTLYGSLIEMADFGKEERETVCRLVVAMVDAWKHINKEKFYSLLVEIWKGNEEMELNKEKLPGLVIEITDLWKDKEKLQSLLVEVSQDIRIVDHNLMIEMARLWVGSGINEVKLSIWLAKKIYYLEHNLLFRLLLHVSFFHNENNTCTSLLRELRNHLRSILDIITDKPGEEEEGSSLYYLISEALEIAKETQQVIQTVDSDPIVVLTHISNIKFQNILQNLSNLSHGLEENIRQAIRVGITAKKVGEFYTWDGGENVVGLEKDIELLLEDIHTVTYIRGMAGIGKTTLARKLYNHHAVVDQFKCRAWVCVSQQLSIKEVSIKLLQQVLADGKESEGGRSWEKMDNTRLLEMLWRNLQGKRYFIVLDDVLKNPYMKLFYQCLPIVKGSRLIFTTRSPRVKFISHGDYTEHKMEFLKADESWELLLKTLFFGTSDKKFPKQLESRGKRVLEKCNGLPLAIKEVGRRWAEMKRSGREWEELFEESIDLSATLEVLERTYQNWDDLMKLRFLHLSLFKEGTTSTSIRITKLEHILLVALAELKVDFRLHHLLKFFEESIIEKKFTTKTNFKVKMYRINPVFQRLSITKAHDEIGLEIVKKGGNNRCSREPRHRAIYCSREKLDYSTNQDKHLVSLFFYGGGYFDTSPSYWKNFEQLKILDMEDFGLKILPEEVETLFELRYLGLRNNYIQELPLSLGHLKKLEVLDIAQNFMVQVPDIIWEMDGLRHLYMSSISCQQPLKIDGLMKLETLTYISVYSWTHELSSFETMSLLCRLGIEEVDRNTDVSKLFASLGKLPNLEFLTLKGFCFRRMPSLDELGILQKLQSLKLDGLLTRLPSVTNFPPNIRSLSLVNSCLDRDPMPILEQLPRLWSLTLENAYTGQEMVISPHRFANLLHLYIGDLWHLRTVRVGERGMPKLKELEINNCPYLETLPEEIWSKELKIVTTKNIATKLRKSRFTSGTREVEVQPY